LSFVWEGRRQILKRVALFLLLLIKFGRNTAHSSANA
jgi:hypothetical protein